MPKVTVNLGGRKVRDDDLISTAVMIMLSGVNAVGLRVLIRNGVLVPKVRADGRGTHHLFSREQASKLRLRQEALKKLLSEKIT